jgi:N-acetylglucosamine-6-phosphate deacetylase
MKVIIADTLLGHPGLRPPLFENGMISSMAFRDMMDLHTHGIGRYDTRAGRARDILRLAELQRGAGVSRILPTIYAGPVDTMRMQMAAVREAMEVEKEGTIVGVHLEGPFLNPVRCGALDRDAFMRPTLPNLRRLIEGFGDVLKIITIAPELKGALRVIEKCAELGVLVNMGHSEATLKEAREGKRAGATGVTHIFNAMRPFHHREPGLVGFGLLDEDLYVEVIGDGIHLRPETLELIFKVKRKDRIILVSDSVRGPVYKGGILQGSGMSLKEAAYSLKGMGFREDWVTKAVRENPRRYLRLRRRPSL